MTCSERNDDLILGLMTGEIGPLRAALLRKHLRRCERCHAHYVEMQALWSELSCSASEPAGESLKQRIAASLPTMHQGVHRTTLMEAFRMRKRLVIAGALLLLAVATGLVASQFMDQKGSSAGKVNGRDWNYVSTFQGRVFCLNPDGSLSTDMGVVMLPGDPSKGEVRLRVDSNEYTLTGVGKHEVRDPRTGELFGFVELQPAPTEAEMAASQAKGIAGVQGTREGATGFDTILGVNWEMKGHGKVTVSVPRDVDAGSYGGVVASYMNTKTEVPELVVKTPKETIKKSGYGVHEIAVADGKAVMTITIEPGNAAK